MKNREVLPILLLAVITAVPLYARAEDPLAPPPPADVPAPVDTKLNDKSNLAPEKNPGADTRNFYNVLEDLMADFEYDLKNGQVIGLKDLSIRNIATSENIPGSFKSHLELI